MTDPKLTPTERCLAAARAAIPDLIRSTMTIEPVTPEEVSALNAMIERESDRAFANILQVFERRNRETGSRIDSLPEEHRNIGELPDRFIEPLGRSLAAHVLFKSILVAGQHLKSEDEGNFNLAGMQGMAQARKVLGAGGQFALVLVDYRNWCYAVDVKGLESANLPPEVQSVIQSAAAVAGKKKDELN